MIDLKREEGDTLYLKLYNFLKKEIEIGKLNHKLSPIRKTSKEFKVSIFTVTKAYELLEKNGYILSKKGSGFYIKHNRNTNNFYPEDYMINEEFRYGYFDDKCEIDFSSASPKSDFFPLELLKESINSILDNEGEKALLYELPQGNINFRKTILKILKTIDIHTELDNIQIISGAQQGINLISQIFIQNGDLVVVEDPTYKGATSSFKEKGATIEKVSLEEEGINLRELESFLKYNKIKLLYIIPTFHNPTGITLSSKKKIELLKLADKYDFYIVEDDSNSELYFSEKVLPLKSFDKKDRVIYIKSYSKVFMPGFRLGFMVAPSEFIKEITRTKYSSDISTSGLNQRIFQYLLEKDIWKNYTEKLREDFKKKQEFLYLKLLKIPNITFQKPEGGLSFWLKLPENISGEALYFKLSKFGIRVIPGTVFSLNFTNYIRLSFAQCNLKDIEKGITTLEKIILELNDTDF